MAAALASSASADLVYLSQDRSIKAEISCGGAKQASAAVGFGAFDASILSDYGSAAPRSVLLPTRVHAEGFASSNAGFGPCSPLGDGLSTFIIAFSLAQPAEFRAWGFAHAPGKGPTYALGQVDLVGSAEVGLLGYLHMYTLTPDPVATFDVSGILPAGIYELRAKFWAGLGGSGWTDKLFYDVTFAIPSPASTSVLLACGLLGRRGRRCAL